MSNKIIIKNILFLRGLDINNIISKYNNYEYSNNIKSNTKIDITSKFQKPNNIIGNNDYYQCYYFKDKIGIDHRMFTTNQVTFDWYKNKNKKCKLLKCNWCRQDITNHPVGIPVSVSLIDDKYIYHVEDSFCSFECCLTQLRRLNIYNKNYKDSTYKNSEQLLLTIYKKLYPLSKKLVERPDWRLLNINGGPLSKQDFESKTHKYIITNKLILLPLKREFIQY